MAVKEDNIPTELDNTAVDPINRDCDSFQEKLQIAGRYALPSMSKQFNFV